ncbi:hypothetical protein BC940DRAFT_371441 [Gongronella butleri]|nr:hypothetical protein BC940DRAFT_371441 [Gongronella butleri]
MPCAHASTCKHNTTQQTEKALEKDKSRWCSLFFFFFWCLGASCCLAFFISLMAMRAHASMTACNTLQKHRKWTKTTDNHFFFLQPWARIMLLPDILCPVIFFSQGHASIWALDTTQQTVKAPEIDENNRYSLYFVILMAIAR